VGVEGVDPMMTSDDKGVGVCTLDEVIKKKNVLHYSKVYCFVKLSYNLNDLMTSLAFLKLDIILDCKLISVDKHACDRVE